MDLLSQDEILRALREINPWWEAGRVPRPFLQAGERPALGDLRHAAEDSAGSGRVVLIGPRGVGKTALLFHLAESLLENGATPTAVFYLPLDHPLLRFVTVPAVLALYRQRICPEAPATLLLDELPRDPAAQAWLETLPATGAKSFRLVATASHSSFAWPSVPLPPFSFGEFVRLRRRTPPATKAIDPLRGRGLSGWSRDELLSLGDELDPLLETYLLRGGFPVAAAGEADPLDHHRRLREGVFERTLVRDIGAVIGVRHTAELERLFLLLCFRTSTILNVRRMAQEVGIGQPTVVHYVRLLEETFLCESTVNVARHLGKALRSQSKVYAADLGLRNAVLLRPRAALREPGERRLLLETAVFLHLREYAAKRDLAVAYWRDGKGRVDLVLWGGSSLLPIQVVLGAAEIAKAGRGMAAFAEKHPGSLPGLVLVAEPSQAPSPGPLFDVGPRTLPISLFLYGLGADGR